MTITAAEVVHHAAPIAALLGVGELRYLTSSKYGAVMNDEWSLSPDQAAALLLGLIVARSGAGSFDDELFSIFDSASTVRAGMCRGWDARPKEPVTDDSRLRARFIAACNACAIVNGIDPTPETTT